MYDRFLVPLDGSDLSEQILPFVRLVAPVIKARVELLHVLTSAVLPPLDPTELTDQLLLEGMLDEFRDSFTQYLGKISDSLRAQGLDVSYRVAEGNVAGAIVDEADGAPATLIAMTTHGRSGISRWLMGSATDKVVQSATGPVLVYRAHTGQAEEDYRLRSILVPLDGSKMSEKILPTVTFLAKAMKLEVALVMVTPTATYLAQGIEVPSLVDSFFEDLSKHSSEYLKGVQQRLSEQGLSSVSVHTPMGRAANLIIETSKSMTDNIVAMTAHGRSGLKRWVMGSVADQVVRHCGDPVLLLRPGDDE